MREIENLIFLASLLSAGLLQADGKTRLLGLI